MRDRDAEYKLIKASRLIDSRGGPLIERGAVLIQGTKISAVGREKEVVPPEGAKVETFDYPEATVMPGLVDCHTHHNGFGDGRRADSLATLSDELLTLQSAHNAMRSLFTGVTTIRENGSKNATTLRLRDAINQGITIGPRMVLCGRAIAIIGGHMGYFGGEATGPVEVRAMTRQLFKEGADYIKITATGGTTKTSFPMRPSFNVDELKAITDEAHKFGKLTATHCTSTQGIINSLDADVDMIIHCRFRDADGSDNFREDVAERIAQEDKFVNPTLHIIRTTGWALQHKQQRELTLQEQELVDSGQRKFEAMVKDCGRLIDRGIKVITGSDSSWGDYQLGNTVYETECLVMAGYTPMQGVLSVTSEAAKALGVEDTVGTLEPGKEADVIVVDGNPAANISALWNVVEVFKAGQRIDRGSDESLAAIRQQRPPSHK